MFHLSAGIEIAFGVSSRVLSVWRLCAPLRDQSFQSRPYSRSAWCPHGRHDPRRALCSIREQEHAQNAMSARVCAHLCVVCVGKMRSASRTYHVIELSGVGDGCAVQFKATCPTPTGCAEAGCYYDVRSVLVMAARCFHRGELAFGTVR